MPEAFELVPYDPDWPARFRAEAARIAAALPGARIEHVGSTSVPGLDAKPFVDILVGLASEDGLAPAIPALEALGYAYQPDAEAVVPERRFFRRRFGPGDERPGYHVHVVARAAPLWRNLLDFRDDLRADPERARRYLALKRELAARHAGDVDAYTVAKGPFVEGRLAALRGAAK